MEPRLVWNWLPRVTGPSLASTREVGKQRQASPEAYVLGALIAHSPQPHFLSWEVTPIRGGAGQQPGLGSPALFPPASGLLGLKAWGVTWGR